MAEGLQSTAAAHAGSQPLRLMIAKLQSGSRPEPRAAQGRLKQTDE
jgi:hypothetical protein